FDLADAGEVLVHLVPVGDADLRLEPLRVFANQIEHALTSGPLAARASLVGRAEQPVKEMARGDFLARGGRFAPPRDAVGIGAAIARVARAGEPPRLAADLEGGELGRRSQVLGRNLVDRDAGADILAVGLHRVTTGKEGRRAAGMV